MANPFVANSGEDPTADLPGSETFGQIRDQWNAFLDQPGGRAALLQAGLSLMQPPSFGDTGFGQLGRAIGAGGEAAGRQEAMDIKQQEAESKQQLRESSANLAGARAATAGVSSQLQQERAANQLTLGKLAASNQLYARYNAFKQNLDKVNEKRRADIVNPQPPLPIPDFNAWVASDPGARDIATRAGMNVGGTETTQPTPTLTSQDQQALDWANQNPGDPRAQQIHNRLGQ